jgi:hypothetical protein
VKKLKYFCLAFLVASLLGIPAAAQGKKGTRNNNGANEPRGQARAEEVQTENGKGDKDHNPSKGSKSRGKKTREGWEKKSQHSGRK